MKKITIDATGKPCPIPVIETKKALQELGDEQTLIEVLVDNEIAVENIKKMASSNNIPTEEKTISAEVFSVVLKKEATTSTDNENKKKSDFVIFFGKEYLGEGNPELGKILMQSYMLSLTELPEIPTHLFFVHNGVLLTNKNSPVLEELKKLETKGTKISTCGLCLDFFNLTDELAVGDITNMYAISLALANAEKTITF